MTEVAEVIVLGMGVGGEEVAGKLAEAGLDVVGIEGRLVGGECPYWGCIPSKMIIRAANLLAETCRVDDIAGRAHAIPDWTPVAERIRKEATDDWNDAVAVKRFTDKGGRFVRGWGRIVEPGVVTVEDTVYRASRAIVIGAGTAPVVPPIEGLADTPHWTNRELLESGSLPDSLVVLGGGAIGVELAQALARFGVAITIVEAADRLLAAEEPETSQMIQAVLSEEDVKLRLKAKAVKVQYGNGFTVQLDDGSKVDAEKLLVSVGRRPKLAPLGVAAIGLDEHAGSVAVDDRMRAGDRVWAVGDITGRGAFTHVAMYQAGIAVRDILGQDGPVADYRALPRVTFTDPEIGSVGMTEAQARKDGLPVATGMAKVPSSARGWIHKAGNEGLIKLVADTEHGVLVGATSAGPHGGEVLGALTVAVHGRVPITQLRQMIYAYPTFHRGIEDALRDLTG
jgi:pyruvate/2-oxoglutarate dehydrogenase complex dihydrolipoamide dehydrogenase (E3) component